MAFTIVQSGTTLELFDTSGTYGTVALPTGITLSALKTPRFTVFQRYVVMVNSPSRPIVIDGDGIARVLSPRPPIPTPLLSAQAGGTLTGTYTVKQTFLIQDALGNVISESDFGPVSNSQAVANQFLRAANLGLSPDAVTASRLYRTTNAGSTYFQWIDLNGNTQTQIQDDLSDASLQLVAAPILGSAPDLTLVAEWRGRLWGTDRILIDNLRYTEAGKMYAWPNTNLLQVPKLGADSFGVTALAARREALGVGRKNQIHQVTGTSNSDFRLVKLTENCGIESQESVCVFRDVAYFLWKDGVYSWSSDGLECISDGNAGKGQVNSWFTTNSYFNRQKFSIAFAQIIAERSVYRLFLCSAGSTTIDRFVDYDLNEKTWWGPHKTDAFSPTCALIRPDTFDVLTPMVGASNGYLHQEQATRTDGPSIAIALDVTTMQHSGDTPDIDKVWMQPTFFGIPQAAGSLTITPSVGELNGPTTPAFTFDLTKPRQRLQRCGIGKHLQFRLTESTAGQDVIITGYEIPFFEAGRR